MRHSLALSVTFESDGLGKIKSARQRHRGTDMRVKIRNPRRLARLGKEPCISEIVGL
jgi:hypothetical protein